MAYLDNDVDRRLRSILREEAIIVYNAFAPKLEKLFRIGKHYFSSLLHNERLINVYQGTSRIIIKLLPKYRIVNVFLNHGWGTKMSPGRKEIFEKKARAYWRILRKYTDYVICYSSFDATYFMRHELLNDLPLPKFIPLGHPRNDFLVRNAGNKPLILQEKEKIGIPKSSKVILFAPTHRESKILKNDYDIKLLKSFMEELSSIDSYLREFNYFMLFRPHYLISNISSSGFKNIIIADSNRYPDPRVLMLISDVLVTDYSSIYVDYLLLKKPIVFYQPDLEYYQEMRGLVVDPNNPVHMPGPKIAKLRDILDLDDEEFQKYDLIKARDFFHKYSDDKATWRLAQFVKQILAEKGE